MSDKPRATLVHNPSAGDERPSADDLVAMLDDAGFQVRYQVRGKGWKKALREPADLIVAAGGDGTLAKVLKAAAGNEVPVALLPLGTANNIGRTFRVLGDVQDIVRGWRHAQPIEVDMGSVSWNGEQKDFIEGCGGGMFAAAIDRSREMIEDATVFLGHELDRALNFLRQHLEEAQPLPWRVEIDGRDHSGDYYTVEVLNIRFAGPSVPIAPEADPTDGQLDVVLIGAHEGGLLDAYLAGRLEDAGAAAPSLTVVRGREIVLGPPLVPFRVDDKVTVDDTEGHGKRPEFNIGVSRGAVRVVAPSIETG